MQQLKAMRAPHAVAERGYQIRRRHLANGWLRTTNALAKGIVRHHNLHDTAARVISCASFSR